MPETDGGTSLNNGSLWCFAACAVNRAERSGSPGNHAESQKPAPGKNHSPSYHRVTSPISAAAFLQNAQASI